MVVTGVDQTWDGIPDVLRQQQHGIGAAVQYGAPVQYGAQVSFVEPTPTMAATGVVMNFDGIPDMLELPQLSFAAPVQNAAPVVTCSLQAVLAAPAFEMEYSAPVCCELSCSSSCSGYSADPCGGTCQSCTCCDLCFSSTYSVCCTGACRRVHLSSFSRKSSCASPCRGAHFSSSSSVCRTSSSGGVRHCRACSDFRSKRLLSVPPQHQW